MDSTLDLVVVGIGVFNGPDLGLKVRSSKPTREFPRSLETSFIFIAKEENDPLRKLTIRSTLK